MRTNHFLTTSALARRLDLPQTRMAALLAAGVIKPDATAGRSKLFNPARIPALVEKIATHSGRVIS